MKWTFDLIRKAQGGDREAFDQIALHFKSYLEFLVHLELGARLQGRLETDDLLQETYLQAFQSLASFRGDSIEAFRSWLGSVALHVIQGQGRRFGAKKRNLALEIPIDQKVRRAWDNSELLIGALAASGTSPSGKLVRQDRLEQLKNALLKLSPDHQEVIRLVRLQGLPIQEAAELLHRDHKAVSVLLWRAMQQLKLAFESAGTSPSG